MAVKYVLRSERTSEYLAKRLFGGYYLTSDITAAVSFKTEQQASEIKHKQDATAEGSLMIDSVNFN